MAIVRAKKNLGQHFLADVSIAREIVDSLSNQYSNVLEIGPGMGVLTQFLFQDSQLSVLAVDVDRESVSYLKEHYPQHAEQIIHGDFLQLNLESVFEGEKFAVLGNFPYNISSQIFFKVIECRERVPEVVCMLQKEVAERLAAKPGSKTYGILSVLLQAYYHIEYLFTVHEHVFKPPPKVKSAVIRLLRNNTQKLDCDEVLFKRVVKTAFNQRRKMIRNSLKGMVTQENFTHPYMEERPEQLSVDDFVILTNAIEKAM